MAQGIRDFCNQEFAAQLPRLQAGEVNGTEFRATVMQAVVQKFSISVAAAATHYNHSLKMQRIVDPNSIKGLGRPEDKKGGRKPVHLVDVIKVKDGTVVAQAVSKGAAELMITKAATAKKAKLAIKEVVTVETPVAEAVTA
jgi:hypothetical protein